MSKQMVVTGTGNLVNENTSQSQRQLAKALMKINSEVVENLQQEESDTKELKRIKEEIDAKCAKLFERRKEIMKARKKRMEQRLFLLGEHAAYKEQYISAGGSEESKALQGIPKKLRELEAVR